MAEAVKGIAVAAGAIASALYYMDWRRRSDPEFKQIRREKVENKPVQRVLKIFDVKPSDIPEDPNDEFRLPRNLTQEDITAYLFKLLQWAEAAFLADETDIGAHHLAMAFVLSGEDGPLMEMMRQELPGDAYRQTMREMPAARVAVERLIYEGPWRR